LWPLKAGKGSIRPQVLHCFQYELGYSVAVAKNDFQNLCVATDECEVTRLPHDLNGSDLRVAFVSGKSELLLWMNPQFSHFHKAFSYASLGLKSFLPIFIKFLYEHLRQEKETHASW
jgi:hypothetical protein